MTQEQEFLWELVHKWVDEEGKASRKNKNQLLAIS